MKRCAILNTTNCSWCNEAYKRGEIMCRMTKNEFMTKMMNYMNKNSKVDIGCRLGPQYNIISYLQQTMSHSDEVCIYCTECSNFDIQITRSGRIVKKPKKWENEKYISGSGISGCDQFDRGFDGDQNSGQYDIYDTPIYNTANLNGFVVADDEEEEKYGESAEEEEFNFSDDDSDDEVEEYEGDESDDEN